MRPELHLIGNAHIDPVWLWQWTEGFHEVKATFRSALDRLHEDPDFIFSASSAAFYDWIEQSDANMFAEIRRRVQEGRWELSGGWWVEPDCNIPCGESFARHALLAQAYFQQKFGRTARSGYAPDSFGHNASLPQILKLSGMDHYVFMRPGPHEKELPGRLFRWQSADGASVVAYQIPFGYESWGQELDDKLERTAAELKPPATALMFFYGVGNHGGGPTRENLASLHRLQARADLPELRFSSPERYFSAVQQHEAELPVVQGELQHHASGCYAAHSGVKRWNRKAENLLLSAEKWSSVAHIIAGQPYPGEELNRAWKDVLFNQFHDILAGTSLEAAYDDTRSQFGEAMTIAGRALNLALQAIAWKINIPAEPGGLPLLAFNPHAWPVRTQLELEVRGFLGEPALLDAGNRPLPVQWLQPRASAGGCQRVCFTAELPALGYAVFRLLRGVHAADFPRFAASDTRLENECLRLEIDPLSGAIASLYDRVNEVEVFAGAGAQGVVIEDLSDTWSHGVFRFDRVVGVFEPVSVKLAEHGPAGATIRVVSRYASSTLTQEFSLFLGSDQVQVQVTVDWHERRRLLKLRFPLNLDRVTSSAEIPFGAIRREPEGDEEPCQGWVDVSGVVAASGIPYGVSLLNDGKYSYDASGADIGLTVLRSPVYANHLPVVPDPNGYYSYMDQGMQHFQYAIFPHPGSWEEAGTVRRAAELNQPAWLQATTYHSGPLAMRGSFLSVEPQNVVVSAFKRAAHRPGCIVRAYETAYQQTAARIAAPLLQRQVEPVFHPGEIKSFFLPDDPAEPVAEVNFLEEPV